jgi:hypothetical protein
MKMHINKQWKIVQLEPITNENQLMAA